MTTLITVLGWITFIAIVCVLAWSALGLLGLVLLYLASKASRTPISIFGFDDAYKLELVCRAIQFGPATLYFVCSLCYYHIRNEYRTKQKNTPINQDKIK